MSVVRIATIAWALALVTGCGGSTGAPPSETPVKEPPWGLDAIALPDDQGSIQAAFDRLPTELLGIPRNDVSWSDQIGAGWGDRFNYLVASLAGDAFNDVTTVEGYMREAKAQGWFAAVDAQNLQPTRGLLFVVGTSKEGPGPRRQYALWGESDAEWVFAVIAESSEMRSALVSAFIEAVEGP